MQTIYFIFISGFYIASLAIVDSAFNRLFFRDKRKHHYKSKEKQIIYSRSEWKIVGVFLLLILPFIIPVLIIYTNWGFRHVLIYLAVFQVVHWDIIFGKLVFDDWFADTPSIALPIIGWHRIPLLPWTLFRILIFILIILYLQYKPN